MLVYNKKRGVCLLHNKLKKDMEEKNYTMKIKNQPYKVEVQKYTSPNMKEKVRKAKTNAAKRVAGVAIAGSIAVGALATPIIGHLARSISNAKDTKEGIKIAQETEDYINQISQNPTLQAVVSAEQTMDLQELSNAISTYKELKNKSNRTYNEEQQFLEANDKICESQNLIIETYRENIEAKIAQAYGMDAKDVKVECPIHDSTNGREYIPQAILNGRETITEGTFLKSGKGMDSTLAKHIKATADIMLIEGYSKDENVSKWPTEKVIEAYEQAIEFNSKYEVTSDKDGNLKTSEIKEKSNNEQNKEDESER